MVVTEEFTKVASVYVYSVQEFCSNFKGNLQWNALKPIS